MRLTSTVSFNLLRHIDSSYVIFRLLLSQPRYRPSSPTMTAASSEAIYKNTATPPYHVWLLLSKKNTVLYLRGIKCLLPEKKTLLLKVDYSCLLMSSFSPKTCMTDTAPQLVTPYFPFSSSILEKGADCTSCPGSQVGVWGDLCVQRSVCQPALRPQRGAAEPVSRIPSS